MGAYFGDFSQTDNFVTVVDPDVFNGFPVGNLTYIHHSGADSKCLRPAPPGGCHRYYMVFYDKDTCMELNGMAANLAGNLDKDDLFDRASGVFKPCWDSVLSVEMTCWQ